MLRIAGEIAYSATDLNNYLACEHLTALDLQVAAGALERPKLELPQAEILRNLGLEHEKRYLEKLAEDGIDVRHIPPFFGDPATAIAETIAAMREGAPVIYQAAFQHAGWVGFADFLVRVDGHSGLGDFHYEVEDTKLARQAEPYFILQLCNYSEHVARIQGTEPTHMHVVLGNGRKESFTVSDFAAHYRAVKQRFLDHIRARDTPTKPYPVRHCDFCAFSERCVDELAAADSLSGVAGMRRSQAERLEASGISTLANLARADDDAKPQAISVTSWDRLVEQARLQDDQRTALAIGSPNPWRWRVLPAEETSPVARGLALLPPRDRADLFFDMEGDPYFSDRDRWFDGDTGLEYLFGVWSEDDGFKPFWGCDRRLECAPQHRSAEKQAFEIFIDYAIAHVAAHPDAHIYHYASYEQTALKRLAERHRTREEAVDALLRAGRLVDLYRVVRQSLRVGEPSYGIKYLEHYYEIGERSGLKKGDDSIVRFEEWLASRQAGNPDGAILADIEQYNRFDCESTAHLLDWLWSLRHAHPEALGVPRVEPDSELADSTTEAREEIAALRGRLFADLPANFEPTDAAGLPDGQRLRWLLGEMLAFYDREAKPQWWQFHDACDTFAENPAEIIERNSSAIGGLRLISREGDRATFAFPAQQHKLKPGIGILDLATRESCGDVSALDNRRGLLEIRLKGDAPEPQAVIEGPNSFMSASLVRALIRISERVLAGGDVAGPLTDVLVGRRPRLTNGQTGGRLQPSAPDARSIFPIVLDLDDSALFIQGPPGSGKTQVGAELIVALISQGKTVGIAGPSHAAAHNLIDRVVAVAHANNVAFSGRYKFSTKKDAYEPGPGVPTGYITSKSKVKPDGSALYAGTPWLFAGTDFERAIDYLFVDEAGQVELAKFAAMTPAARNIVLLGDPAQLSQVAHTTHPGDVGLSVLEYLLDGEATIPADRGIFLTQTHRMQRDICAFVSELAYGCRLHESPACNSQGVHSRGISGSGLRAIPVAHEGNRSQSPEEADRIADEIAHLLKGRLTDREGHSRAIEKSDIIVVSPYNAQRNLIDETLQARFGDGIEVGTVNKFQGREAYVVFYSMATSSDDDMARSSDFLFERNRLNVAVSRARALAVLVYSPSLLAIATPSVNAMRLVNGLDRFLELAQTS